MAFNGSFAPGADVKLPLPISVFIQQNGTTVNDAGGRHTFHNSAEVANIAFSFALLVTSVPAVLTVVADGGKFFYSDVSLTIYKIGELN